MLSNICSSSNAGRRICSPHEGFAYAARHRRIRGEPLVSILATADFFIHPEKADEFLGIMKEALPDTRNFEGCEHLDTYVDQDQPGHILLVERWASRSAHEAYLAWRMETGMLDMLGPFVSAPPQFAYFDLHPEI
jgi:quinol monooxygenase YgiN